MRRRDLLLTLTGSAMAWAADDSPQVPRTAPEFSILLPEGGGISLAQHRGKVVVIEFLMTTCPHCQEAAKMMTRLQAEYGPRGFLALGCSFDPMPRLVVPDFVRDHGVKHPVGYSTREEVYAFLDVDLQYGIHVPQIVFVDRKGVIRHQSRPRGDGETGREANVRKWIEDLLKEPVPKPR